MLRILFSFYLISILFSPAYMSAQKRPLSDTVKLDMDMANRRFVSKNLVAIAARFNINIAQALVIQAKAYYNPNFSIDNVIYGIDHSNPNFPDGETKLFDYTATGNTDAQITQLVSIAGRYVNTVKLAKVAESQTELAFQDFMRALYYQMYSDYKNIFYTQQQYEVLAVQEKALADLIKASEQMLKLGAISGNELFRLKAELNDLENQSISILSNLYDLQTDMKVLLSYPDSVYLVVSERKIDLNALPTYDQALTTAETTRPDVLLAHKNVEYTKRNLSLQKSIAYPNLAFFMNYTRRGSYLTDYTGAGIALDLPVFNHNQGNIKAARYGISQAVVNDTLKMNVLSNEIATSYVTFLVTKTRFEKFDATYSKQLEELKDFAFQNYKKRNINLLEFLDQLRTYNAAKISLINLNSSLMDAANDFNFKTGKLYFK